MKYDHPEIIDPALDLIKSVDPDLHAEIAADDTWNVHVVMKGEEGFDDFFNEMAGAVGSTRKADVKEDRISRILMALLEPTAGALNVPVTDYVAATLVHEYRHHDDDADEPEAYKFELVFDRKLPVSDAPIVDDASKELAEI